jgi:hypothetical protein
VRKNLISVFAFFAAINIRKLKIILNFLIVGSIEKEILLTQRIVSSQKIWAGYGIRNLRSGKNFAGSRILIPGVTKSTGSITLPLT